MALSERNIRNIAIYTLPKFASYGLNLLTLPILTRILTPADFGIITLALAVPTIAVSVLTAGLTSSVARYYFEYKNDSHKLNKLYCSTQLYLFLMLVVSAVVAYVSRKYIAQLVTGKTDYGIAVFIAYMATYFGQMNVFYLRIYQNMEKAVLHSTFVIVQAFTSVAMSLLLVWYFKMSYMGMIYGSMIGAMSACLIMGVHFNRQVQLRLSKNMLAENLRYGLQVVPKSFTGFINRYFDKYMLNAMLSMAAVGVFNIGQTIANVFFVLMSNVWMSFQPVYYKEVFDRGERASTDVGRMFTVFAYVTLLPVILGVLFAQEALYIIAPPEYYGAVDVLVILATGIATQTFGMYVGIQYAYSKKPFFIFPVVVTGTVLNVILNIYLIPVYGLIGAGLATTASTAATNLILTWIGQKLYRIRYEWQTIVPLFVNTIAAAILVLYMRAIDINSIYLYSVKMIVLVTFIYIGVRAGIITRGSIVKVVSAFYYPRRKEV